MFLNRRLFAALAVCLCLSATTAFAGNDGGTKKDSTITVTNNTSSEIGVAVNPSASLLASTTPEQFVARGGKILAPGDTYTVKVRSGAQRVLVVDEDGDIVADTSVSVGKGATRAGFVTGSGLAF
jgi:hypothetical protein